MRQKSFASVETHNRRNGRLTIHELVPLRIFISVQNGRQYLMAYIPRLGRISSYRLDNILSVETGKRCERFDEYREKLASMQGHIWGVSTGGGEELEHIDFTLRYGDEEEYIHRRLEREKRCGKVEKIDEHTSRFLAEVFDSYELIPWIRTFICRITDIHFSNPETEACFKADLKDMYRLYGLEGGEKNDF